MLTIQKDKIILNGIPVSELVARYGTPLYVYDFNQIQETVEQLLHSFASLGERFRIYYAMKANHNPAVVAWIQRLGVGMDVTSPYELQLALDNGVSPGRIIYTGNYESESELAFAFKRGVLLNLDSLEALERLARIGIPEKLSFRINPDYGRGRFQQTTTGGRATKFGLPHYQAVEAYARALKSGVKQFGAHCMTGSGVTDPEHFKNVLRALLPILGEVRDKTGIQFEFIDIGGGMGIPYSPGESPLDLPQLGHLLTEEFLSGCERYNLGQPVFSIEPGRLLVGEAGYLITRVNGTKRGYKNFVGLDAGMNTLLRPALYGTTHTVLVDGKATQESEWICSLCGQICENTDILFPDLELPSIQEGDLVVILQAGAYGHVMSSNYNLRPRTAEVALLDGKDYLIRKAENFQDLCRNYRRPPFLEKS